MMSRDHYSVSTERTYCDWIKQYVRFHGMQNRESLFGEAENKVEKFLTYLATERTVEASCKYLLFQIIISDLFCKIWNVRVINFCK